MDFKDYGKMEFFDTSKGFGFARTVYNEKVFIRENNVIFGSINNSCYVLIGDLNRSNANNRPKGINITAWDQDNNSFCEEIFQFWFSKQPLIFNADVKWLLENCTEHILEKIINSNKDNWLYDIEFLTHLKNCSLRGNSYYIGIVREYIFEVWVNTGNNKCNQNLMWLLEHCNDESTPKSQSRQLLVNNMF